MPSRCGIAAGVTALWPYIVLAMHLSSRLWTSSRQLRYNSEMICVLVHQTARSVVCFGIFHQLLLCDVRNDCRLFRQYRRVIHILSIVAVSR